MLDYVIVLTLGFLFGGSLSFAMLPAVWNRARRLILRELEAGIPISMTEVRAGQDHIRAESAIKLQKMDRQVAAERDKRQEAWLEVGRQIETIRLLTTQNTLFREQIIHAEKAPSAARIRLQQVERDLAEARTQAKSAKAEAQQAKAELTARAEAAQKLVVSLEKDKARLTGDIEQARAHTHVEMTRNDAAQVMIASLEEDKVKLIRQLEEAQGRMQPETKRADDALARVASLEADKENLTRDLEAARSQKQSETTSLQALLASAKSLIANLQQEIVALKEGAPSLKKLSSSLQTTLPEMTGLSGISNVEQLRSEIALLAARLVDASDLSRDASLIDGLMSQGEETALLIARRSSDEKRESL